jgi:hypothetical protein
MLHHLVENIRLMAMPQLQQAIGFPVLAHLYPASALLHQTKRLHGTLRVSIFRGLTQVQPSLSGFTGLVLTYTRTEDISIYELYSKSHYLTKSAVYNPLFRTNN